MKTINNNPSFGLNVKIKGLKKVKNFGLSKKGNYDTDVFQKNCKELENLKRDEDVKVKFKNE